MLDQLQWGGQEDSESTVQGVIVVYSEIETDYDHGLQREIWKNG